MSHCAKPCPPDCDGIHHVPESVRQHGISCIRYNSWVDRQARTCKRRDAADRRQPIEVYREAIHKAVLRSSGLDEYTGEALEWNRLNHERPAGPGRRPRRINGRYPSVDHYQGPNVVTYRICAGTVNFAKGALDHRQFVSLCRMVVAHHEGWCEG